MKLGELRAAIRKHKGVVLARAELGGVLVDIPVQKTGFLEMLDAYGENKGVESGLIFTDAGIVTTKELSDAQLDAGAALADTHLGADSVEGIDCNLDLDLDLDLTPAAPEPVATVDDLLGDIDLDLDLLG